MVEQHTDSDIQLCVRSVDMNGWQNKKNHLQRKQCEHKAKMMNHNQ